MYYYHPRCACVESSVFNPPETYLGMVLAACLVAEERLTTRQRAHNIMFTSFAPWEDKVGTETHPKVLMILWPRHICVMHP